jgi:hypothetical protein
VGDLIVRAGKNVYTFIQDGGFSLDAVRTYVGPGVGPRWLIASGFDMTLLEQKALGQRSPLLLAGSSAGAFRFAAWVQPEAVKSYRSLIEGYIAMTFDRAATPRSILESLSNLIDTYVEHDAIPFALANSSYRLAIVTARAKNLTGYDAAAVQRLGLAFSFLANAMNMSWLNGFFERVVFYNGPIPPRFCLRDEYVGQTVKLHEANFKHALLASGAIPLVVAGVKNIYGAPNGTYRDGGLTDYHINQRYSADSGDVTLFFHHQERIIPGWLDKSLRYRQPKREFLDNVLIIHPSESFVKKMPRGKIPDRNDFKEYVNNPAMRVKNWRRAVELSAHLGEEFLEMIESGQIRNVVNPM